MSVATVLENTPVIDGDTHVIETPELWTSRLPKKWRDDAPRVDPDGSVLRWRVGDVWLNSVAHSAHAGWRDFTPSNPPSLEEADPSTWQPVARLAKMDEYGIAAQLLYPNILGFDSTTFLGHRDQEFAFACIRAYNDFLTEEYYQLAPDRFIPITVIPFWNLEASLAEIKRCREQGHKGVLVANRYERAGLPSFVDSVWDPLYALAQEMGCSVNFHVGFQSANPNVEMTSAELLLIREVQQQIREDGRNREARATYARLTIPVFFGNAETITALLTSDICERFPKVNFVSVESGFGYIPYLLEAIDWQWEATGARATFGDRLLPSEYFRRQCYGTFWFERSPLSLLEHFPDNFMFSTDFPHSTSLSPGPASPAEMPMVHANKAFAGLPDEVVRKAVHGNAARIYHVD